MRFTGQHVRQTAVPNIPTVKTQMPDILVQPKRVMFAKEVDATRAENVQANVFLLILALTIAKKQHPGTLCHLNALALQAKHLIRLR